MEKINWFKKNDKKIKSIGEAWVKLQKELVIQAWNILRWEIFNVKQMSEKISEINMKISV